MAHSCPECGQVCYCGGDIDDCEFDNTPEQMACICCADDYVDDDLEFEPDTSEQQPRCERVEPPSSQPS